jgi:undecaprenyl diphosphate synthase
MSKTNFPQHIAIIMDGNRRWANERGLPKIFGHTEGVKTFRDITEYAGKQGIKYLTFWALSTENFKKRSQEELEHIFTLMNKQLDRIDDLLKNNIQLRVIGDVSKLPQTLQEKLTTSVERSKNDTGMVLILAINYGGRDELVRAVKKMLEAEINSSDISEETIPEYLDTAGIPDPDLIIRTGGDQRLSGYFPWQSIYSELYFTPIKWPDFSHGYFDEALSWFNEQKRNKGK